MANDRPPAFNVEDSVLLILLSNKSTDYKWAWWVMMICFRMTTKRHIPITLHIFWNFNLTLSRVEMWFNQMPFLRLSKFPNRIRFSTSINSLLHSDYIIQGFNWISSLPLRVLWRMTRRCWIDLNCLHPTCQASVIRPAFYRQLLRHSECLSRRCFSSHIISSCFWECSRYWLTTSIKFIQ